MTQKKLTNKRRLNNKKATCKKYLLPKDNKQISTAALKKTTALELLFQLGLLNEDCVLAGKQYALIKYKRPIGGPSGIRSNLQVQLTPRSKEKKLWDDAIINDELEDIWRESQKVTNKISTAVLEKIVIDNCPKMAAFLAENKQEMQQLKEILSDLSALYKNHKSTNFLLNEMT